MTVHFKPEINGRTQQNENPYKNPIARSTDLGTLAWGRREGPYEKGRLTLFEKLQVLKGLGSMAGLEGIDWLKERIGLMSPISGAWDDLLPTDSTLVQDSLAYARECFGAELLNHSWRTYLYGMFLGQYRGLEVNREILFAASMLHDLGLGRHRKAAPGHCCFVVEGAEQAYAHLCSHGHNREKVQHITECIGLHLNGYVSARLYGAEAHLLARGATLDVTGLGGRRLAKTSREALLADFPPGDLHNALETWPNHHMPETRASLFIALNL